MEHKELLIKYYRGLVNAIFKLLPILENSEYGISKRNIHITEQSIQNYQMYLCNLLVEVHGNSHIFFCSENSIKLVSILRGMILITDHKQVKQLTMECIRVCKKIIKEVEDA